MEFALAVTFGSSLQVALFVAPVLVLLGPRGRPAHGPRLHPARDRRRRGGRRHQLAHRDRRRDELARGRAADARLRDPRRSRSSSSSARARSGAVGDGAEGVAPPPGMVRGSGRRFGSSASPRRSRRPRRHRPDEPGSNAASAIGSVAGASPSATRPGRRASRPPARAS